MTARFASPIDAFAFGDQRITAPPAPRGLVGRITDDGSSGLLAEPGRYHLYAGRFCPRSHRATIQLALNGLTGVVSVSYVDGLRDGRGWAFRERTGPDPVNGFTLLRQAYEAGDPRYAGPVTIPALWDRHSSRIVSSDPDTIDLDLATAFRPWATPGVDLYPAAMREDIHELGRRVHALDQTIVRAVFHQAARDELRSALGGLDRRLANRRYLLGDTLTVADVRLWVVLVRYDAGPNANGAAGPPLTRYAHLWAYARALYAMPAFGGTTDFDSFTAPLTTLPDWR